MHNSEYQPRAYPSYFSPDIRKIALIENKHPLTMFPETAFR
jgi:hypothetical protein